MSLSTLLDQRLSIQRQTITPDPSGGAGRSFSTLLTSVPCAVAPATAAVAADYARRDLVVDYHVYTTADFDSLIPGGLGLRDRLTDGAVFYLVKAVRKSANAMVSNEVIYQIDCERRQ
ncbi:MAG: hypothetical protein JWN24_53 [Phycisphaerales bacterium]|nr:hypothetical protein [Phycisphaerales bacterium]